MTELPVRVLGIGEVLWDVFDEAERLGGAPLNCCVNLARLGHDVAILSAVGRDARGDAALAAIAATPVSPRFVGRTAGAPTGVATVELDGAGAPSFRIARPAAWERLPLEPAVLDAIAAWQPDWLVLGTLGQAAPAVRHATEAVRARCPTAAVLLDVNLRPGWRAPEIHHLLDMATVVKASESEAATLLEAAGLRGGNDKDDIASVFCRWLASSHDLRAVCATLGASGSVLLLDGQLATARAYPVRVVDTVGAGDAYAAALVHGIALGWPAARVADFASRVAAIVASRPGAAPPWSPDEALALGPPI